MVLPPFVRGGCLLLAASCAHAFTVPSTQSIVQPHHATTRQSSFKLPRRQHALSMSTASSNHNHNRTPRDILIIGGGLAGLSTAYHIATTSGRHVTLLERELPTEQRAKTTAGSFAAAGMLAPQSERLPAGPLLDICLNSREMYGEWVGGVERGAREASLGVSSFGGRTRRGIIRRGTTGIGNRARGYGSGSSNGEAMYTGEGAKYLWELSDEDGLEPWETGFHSTGGFLAPAFAGDAVATWSPQPNSGKSYWLDDVQVRELEPQLHPDVVGGWWFPEDASVDARRLTCSLRAACVGAGVQMNFGPEWEVSSLEMSKGKCEGVHLANGKIYSANAIVVANGSWMRHLLPLPVTPHKGQSFSLRMPSDAPPILSRVLFAQDTYIVPKADGRIIVGATVEPGRFDGDVTPSGMMHCLSEATRLIPKLGELPIEESWAGLRPTTPDKCPILGSVEQFDNVYLAGGYWRNGVLLAPKTGQLVGDLIVKDGKADEMSEEDQALLKAFSWDRFTAAGGGKALAANARYAATFYPVHKRSTDGVATSVGTELGFYEGAAAAKGDRERDRKAMFGMGEEEEAALERAAGMGVGDAAAFSFGDVDDGWMVRKNKGSEAAEVVIEESSADLGLGETMAVDADPDALTVGVAKEEIPYYDIIEEETNESLTDDLPSIYEKIKANKAKASESIEMGENPTEERPDPGFRIYHIDKMTRETTEVPPYTSPGEFFQMKAEGKLESTPSEDGEAIPAEIASDSSVAVTQPSTDGEKTEKTTYDGYTAIREAYGEGTTIEDTAAAMRKARMNNRIKTSEIDESKIGAMYMSNDGPSVETPPPSNGARDPSTTITADDLSAVYDKIKSNKALANQNIEMGESTEEERPQLDFTIYHVDSETREVREVPQYTSPGEFLQSIEKEKAGDHGMVNGARTLKASIPSKGAAEKENMVEEKDEVNSDIIDDGSDEKTYDGYQAIQSANSSESRAEELRRMKEARMANRLKASGIMGNSLDL